MRNLQEHNMKNIHRKLIPKKYSKFFDDNEEELITMKRIEPKNPSNEQTLK